MTAKEKLLKWVKSQYDKEKDKWSCGSKNNYYEWEYLYDKIQAWFEIEELKKQMWKVEK